MSMHTLRRRMSALGAVLGLSIALPLTTGATPAYAQAQMSVTKSHEGNFVRGGQGTYHFEFINTGDAATTGTVRITDQYPQGLTFAAVNNVEASIGTSVDCPDITSQQHRHPQWWARGRNPDLCE
ncbi:hypothetical protein MTF65_25395 [Streptomyces sp. APSN-46.1]|uniref:hypothetical protein n=1 Tax=Streptomyces sp. APSN-46.1 TaxID=2929049 RepID=UPI001FB3D369|nr:hypothetical protein [Streptomyces sp. APSN-46.1]MCJ1680623.1 hypothetical protein [Streptomyces sp. APSN-46.1]